MKPAAKTRTPKPARRKPAVEAVAAKGHAPAFREIIGLIQSARQRAYQAVNTELIGLYWRSRTPTDAGIVIDGAGIGSAIAANKIRGVRAAMCTDETLARYSREHNGANVLTLGSTLLSGADAAIRIVDTWMGTAMREARYIRRLLKVRRLEENPE